MVDKIAEESIEITVTEMIVMIEVGIGLERGCFPESMTIIELGVQAIGDQGQDLKCARAQSISQCVDAGQLNVPPWQ